MPGALLLPPRSDGFRGQACGGTIVTGFDQMNPLDLKQFKMNHYLPKVVAGYLNEKETALKPDVLEDKGVVLKPPEFQQKNAVVVFADVSNFTKITNTLVSLFLDAVLHYRSYRETKTVRAPSLPRSRADLPSSLL